MGLSGSDVKFLTDNIASPLVRVIATAQFGEPIGAGAGVAAKWIGDKFKDAMTARDVERKLQGLADKVVRAILPIFENSEESRAAIGPVSFQLQFAVNGIANSQYLIKNNLDADRIIGEVEKKYKLPVGQHSELETQLYKRSLDLIVRCVVEFAPLLPRFTEESVRKQLQALAAMDARFDQLVDDIRSLEEAVSRVNAGAVGASTDDQRFELEYRLSLIKKLDYLELFGADIASEARYHELSVAYISLNLASSIGSDDVEYGSMEALLSQIAVRDRKRLLIRGEAGSGKSTLLRWAALYAARPRDYEDSEAPQPFYKLSHHSGLDGLTFDELEARISEHGAASLGKRFETLDAIDEHLELNEAAKWQQRVPFLVRMRECQQNLPTVVELVPLCSRVVDREPPGWAARVLRAGRGMVLFDGIDEVPNMNRAEIAKQIAEFVKQYPDNLFIVSTRPAAVPAEWLSAHGFIEAQVNPLGERDRIALIDRWHLAVARQVGVIHGVEPDLGGQAEKLKRELRENPALSRLATNPLLCAMICALHHARSSSIPQSAADLCEALCHMLLERREAEAGIDLSKFPLAYRNLSYSQKKALVRELAHFMVRNEVSSIGVSDADGIIAKTYKQFPNLPDADTELVRGALVERTGVLREPVQGALDFIHNTIKEYLAAEQFVDDDDFGLLASRALDSSWQSVLAFAAGSPHRNAADRLIGAILERAAKSTDIDEARKWRLLAMRCAASAVRISAKQKAEVDGVTKTLFPPKNMTEAEALAFGGDVVVSQLKYNRRNPARVAAACVRALRLIGTTRARAEIKPYLGDPRWTVVNEAIQDTNPLYAALVRRAVTSPTGAYYLFDVGRLIDNVEPLRNVPDMSVLHLAYTQVTDISPIAGCETLKQLDLTRAPIEDWQPISTLSNLEVLLARGTTLNDDVLRDLEMPKHLQKLNIEGTTVSTLAAFESYQELMHLSATGTKVAALNGLEGIESLVDLEVGGTELASINVLPQMQGLSKLTLRSPRVSDVLPIAKIFKLRRLQLSIDPKASLMPLLDLENLESLAILSTPFPQFLDCATCSKITNLHLNASGIASLSSVTRFPDLKAFGLSDFAAENLNTLSDAQSLTQLSMRRCQISSLDGIERLASLHELALQDVRISDPSALERCEKLRTVVIGPEQSDIIEYIQSLPGIRVRVGYSAFQRQFF